MVLVGTVEVFTPPPPMLALSASVTLLPPATEPLLFVTSLQPTFDLHEWRHGQLAVGGKRGYPCLAMQTIGKSTTESRHILRLGDEDKPGSAVPVEPSPPSVTEGLDEFCTATLNLGDIPRCSAKAASKAATTSVPGGCAPGVAREQGNSSTSPSMPTSVRGILPRFSL